MPRYFQYICAILLGVTLYLFDSYSPSYSANLCLLLILFFGVPHGAVDHKIHQSTSRDKNLRKYIITYLVIAGGYILWWLLDPAKALLIFILLSAFHFGQEILEDKRAKGRYPLAGAMIWGSAILIGPMFLSISEIDSYIQVVAGFSLTAIPVNYALGVAVAAYAIAIVHLVISRKQNLINQEGLAGLVTFLLINLLLHLLLDFIMAFTVYFVCFHSMNAFKHQFVWLSSMKKHYTFKRFLLDLSLFGIISIVGIVGIIWVVNPNNMDVLISIFFILISLITLPHAITLDHFYRVRKVA